MDRGMALIECYECKGKVSSEAKACPHCGLPIKVEIEYYENGQMEMLSFLKDGERHGLWAGWYKNGQKAFEANYKDGKLNGLTTQWYANGQKELEGNYKDGKLMSAVVWKPNGEKCPVTNVNDGTGVVVWYNEDGTERWRLTYKDGEKVWD